MRDFNIECLIVEILTFKKELKDMTMKKAGRDGRIVCCPTGKATLRRKVKQMSLVARHQKEEQSLPENDYHA